MRHLLMAALIGVGTTAALPVFAQGLYIGPGGVGVDSGIHRGYDRDRDAYRGRDEYRGRRTYEGRSAYDRDNGPRDRY